MELWKTSPCVFMAQCLVKHMDLGLYGAKPIFLTNCLQVYRTKREGTAYIAQHNSRCVLDFWPRRDPWPKLFSFPDHLCVRKWGLPFDEGRGPTTTADYRRRTPWPDCPAVIYCWPSPAQSFLVSGPVGTRNQMFVNSKTIGVSFSTTGRVCLSE
jgi:hypothetical protein